MFGDNYFIRRPGIVQWDPCRSSNDLLTLMDRVSISGLSQEEFILTNWSEYERSDEYNSILVAKDYFRNKNDITKRKRQFRGREGQMCDDPLLANNRLSHAFFNKMTRQKTNYLLAKPYTINADEKKFSDILNETIGSVSFRRMLKRVVKEAIIAGLAWVQIYYDEDGDLAYQRIPPEQIKPFWKDSDHTELEAVIRRYSIDVYHDNCKEKVYKFEFWYRNSVWYYQLVEGCLVPDPDRVAKGLPAVTGHFNLLESVVDELGYPIYNDQGVQEVTEIPQVWDIIPFIPFKYNSEEMSLLDLIKSLIDDYDARTSDNSNQIEDIPNSIKLVKGYEGTDPDEFINYIRLYRTAFVNHDGEMSSVDNPLGITESDVHLNRLRKDIYEFGFGVDTQSKETGNSSGVALKFLYADLDMDCYDLGNELSYSLEQVIWFLAVDLAAKGQGDYTEVNTNIVFNTDITINETETINNLVQSQGILSEETILENHPYVVDAREEMKQRKKEEQDNLDSWPTQQFPLASVGGSGTAAKPEDIEEDE